MLGLLKKMFGIKPAESVAETVAEAPYKVESSVVSSAETVQTQVPKETAATKAKVQSATPAKPKAGKPVVAKAPAAPKKPRATKIK